MKNIQHCAPTTTGLQTVLCTRTKMYDVGISERTACWYRPQPERLRQRSTMTLQSRLRKRDSCQYMCENQVSTWTYIKRLVVGMVIACSAWESVRMLEVCVPLYHYYSLTSSQVKDKIGHSLAHHMPRKKYALVRHVWTNTIAVESHPAYKIESIYHIATKSPWGTCTSGTLSANPVKIIGVHARDPRDPCSWSWVWIGGMRWNAFRNSLRKLLQWPNPNGDVRNNATRTESWYCWEITLVIRMNSGHVAEKRKTNSNNVLSQHLFLFKYAITAQRSHNMLSVWMVSGILWRPPENPSLEGKTSWCFQTRRRCTFWFHAKINRCSFAFTICVTLDERQLKRLG